MGWWGFAKREQFIPHHWRAPVRPPRPPRNARWRAPADSPGARAPRSCLLQDRAMPGRRRQRGHAARGTAQWPAALRRRPRRRNLKRRKSLLAAPARRLRLVRRGLQAQDNHVAIVAEPVMVLESAQIRRRQIKSRNDSPPCQSVRICVYVGGRLRPFAFLGPALQHFPVPAQEEGVVDTVKHDASMAAMIKSTEIQMVVALNGHLQV